MKYLIKKMAALLFFVLLLTGCLSNGDRGPVPEGTELLTSFHPIYMFTKEIVKDTPINVINMANTQTECLHDYQLTTDDMRKILDCQAFIINGNGMENSFIKNALEQNPHLVVIDSGLSAQVLFVDEHDNEHIHNNEHEHIHNEPHDHEHGEINPHTWLSPTNAKIQIGNIADELSKMYPKYSETLRKNAEDYCNLIDNSLALILENNNNLKAVSFHEGFTYLANDIGFKVEKSVTVEENHLPSTKELDEISTLCGSGKISFIICADDEGKKYAKLLALETGLPLVILDPFVSGNSYIDVQIKNYETLKAVLSVE